MSFIRGAIVTLFGIVLTVCLIFMNVSITFASSLEYDSLKPALEDSAKNIIESVFDVETTIGKENLNHYCSIEKEYVLNLGDDNFVIPCGVIEQGEESIFNYVRGNFIEQIYYANYNCEFWKCVSETQTPFVLISDKARVYWYRNVFLLAALSLVLFALILFIAENRSSKFVSVGVLVALCALPFRNIDWMLKMVSMKAAPLFLLLSQKANLVFIIMLIVSIVLVLIGAVALIFGWKMKFKYEKSENKDNQDTNGVSKEEVREIVREEINKKNLDEKKQIKKSDIDKKLEKPKTVIKKK